MVVSVDMFHALFADGEGDGSHDESVYILPHVPSADRTPASAPF